MNESCGTCRFSDPRIDDDGEPYLRCRRWPPVLLQLGEAVSTFSQTSAEEWCGEYQEQVE